MLVAFIINLDSRNVNPIIIHNITDGFVVPENFSWDSLANKLNNNTTTTAPETNITEHRFKKKIIQIKFVLFIFFLKMKSAISLFSKRNPSSKKK